MLGEALGARGQSIVDQLPNCYQSGVMNLFCVPKLLIYW